MGLVEVSDVQFNSERDSALDPFEFVVTFESRANLQEELDWRLIYVGDPTDTSEDQELECISLGPITAGHLRFTMIADPPDFTKIDPDDAHGMTVVLLTASYREQEFLRIGWFVRNVYEDPDVEANPPPELDLQNLRRVVHMEEPRVTRFQINWDACDENAVSRVLGAAEGDVECA
ncbi:MAG: uncharacterized protein KVP18_004096 [Porospora cf. gigantea A]|uniref:uncharacterized protein n=1 Tax=Porospora cf. gigantea A TaxID=2853593 RepID=UPI00355A977C|nr:MAG: hypothetical protein KVP18_004096 [Porospora cf. gigantea A]